MKAVLQRAGRASVAVDGEVVGEIGQGLVVFLCVEDRDDETTADYFARKIARMRIFGDDQGRMNLSLLDISGGALAISQFTLAAEWRKGNRPGFSKAAEPDKGESLYRYFCSRLEHQGVVVRTGRFGAHMDVRLVNDGPVTIWMDSQDR